MNRITRSLFSVRLLSLALLGFVSLAVFTPSVAYADQESDCISSCESAFPSATYTPDPGDPRTPQQQASYDNYHTCVNACIDQFGDQAQAAADANQAAADAAAAAADALGNAAADGGNTTTGNGATTPTVTNPTGGTTPSGKVTNPGATADRALPTLLPECATTTGSCGICDVFAMFGNIAEILLDLISGVVILMVIVGGFFWISSAGSSDRIDRGKQILIGAFMGSIFVFAGFVLVNLTMIALLGGSGKAGNYGIVSPFGNTEWNKICSETSAVVPPAVNNTATGQNPAPAPVPVPAGSTCYILASGGDGRPCKESTCNDVNTCVCKGVLDPSSGSTSYSCVAK